MEAFNFMMTLDYEPLGVVALPLLAVTAFLLVFLSARSLIQKHDLEQLQKREAVLLKIKDNKDTQEYYNRILLSHVREPDHRGLL